MGEAVAEHGDLVQVPGLLPQLFQGVLLETAFLEAQGTTPFAFTDPATGQIVPRCVIAQDRFVVGSHGEMLAGAQLAIEEIL